MVWFVFQAEDGIRDYDVTGVQTVLFRATTQPLFPERNMRTHRFLIVSIVMALCAMFQVNAMLAGEILPPIGHRFASADVSETPSFQKHVVPLLSRLGCNGRACHGSFQGRGGLRLSPFGYDFQRSEERRVGKEWRSRVSPYD